MNPLTLFQKACLPIGQYYKALKILRKAFILSFLKLLNFINKIFIWLDNRVCTMLKSQLGFFNYSDKISLINVFDKFWKIEIK